MFSESENGITGLVKNIRRSYLGSTTELDAADLYNQGRVVSGQWNPDLSLTTREIKTGSPAVLTDVFDYYTLQTPAVTSSAIVQSDEFVREAEAKSGSYLPLRPCAPTFELTASTEYRRLEVEYPGEGLAGVNGTEGNDIFLRGWSIAVEAWLGIDVRANLRIKRREGIELVPAPDSTYSPFATPALPNDVRAKEVLEEFCRTQPHAYPADFNDLGSMIPNILGGIADVVGSLGLPLISPAANLVRKYVLPDKPTAKVEEIIASGMPLLQKAVNVEEDDMAKMIGLMKKVFSK